VTAPTPGYLLIADITGYTAFLHGSELDHAQGILTQLLKLLLEETRRPMVVSRTAGDAVISYAMGEPFLQSQTLVDRLEHTYGAFREAIDRMVLNNHCTCAACVNVAALDLKFFLHHGTFAVQDLGGHDELVGSDVNLLHRLLKNSVVEDTGITAYALYTRAAIDQLNLGEWEQGLKAHTEHYEHLGEVEVRVQDLSPIAEAARAARSVRIPLEQTRTEHIVELDAPAAAVWDALTDPDHRKVLMGSTSMARGETTMSEGSEFICYHGDILTKQEIVVYDPLRRLVTHERVHLPLGVLMVPVEYELQPSDRGIRLIERFGGDHGPWYVRLAGFLMHRFVVRPHRAERLGALKSMIEGTLAPIPT
jgi:hypothetical protein